MSYCTDCGIDYNENNVRFCQKCGKELKGLEATEDSTRINKKDEQDKIVNEIYEYAINLLVEEKKTEVEVKSALMNKGIDEETSSIIIKNIKEQLKKSKSEGAIPNIIIGAIFFIGGIIFTISSYNSASEGGSYFITWGAIVFGFIQMIKGFSDL